jgi:hypothetical protein
MSLPESNSLTLCNKDTNKIAFSLKNGQLFLNGKYIDINKKEFRDLLANGQTLCKWVLFTLIVVMTFVCTGLGGILGFVLEHTGAIAGYTIHVGKWGIVGGAVAGILGSLTLFAVLAATITVVLLYSLSH